MALYRVGRAREASETLARSDRLNGGAQPADLAFLAMAHHRLGDAVAARAALGRLRDVVAKQRSNATAESRGFLREAEALIERPPSQMPVNPFARP